MNSLVANGISKFRGTEAASSDRPDSFLEFLRHQRILTDANVERVARVGAESGDRLTAILLNSGLISESDLSLAIANFAGLERIDASALPQEPTIGDQPISERLSATFMRAHEVIPIDVSDDELTIACWDVLDDFPVRALRFSLNVRVNRVVVERKAILDALDMHYPAGTDGSDPDSEVSSVSDDLEVDRLRDLASEEPIIRLVQRVISEAVASRASDIHFEPIENGMQIRFRRDGLLQRAETHPRRLAAPIISRIKVMAGLNIAERRLPQDGRISVTLQGKEVDFRAASAPTLHGEMLTLRILNRQDISLDFQALGFDAQTIGQLEAAVNRPFGIVLVTGPTGSGKTTTLYAALKTVNRREKKVLTIEDPVEYVLDNVNQVHVRPDIGLGFSTALRSFLRLDPDVLMVGEIRDRETAEIAVQAALTGHLLLSTLHTNSAASAVTRLLDMGLDDYLLTSTLHLILGQRLVRRLCPRCRVPYEPSAELRERFALPHNDLVWHRPRGCPDCQQTGWNGRTTLIEALGMDDSLRSEVLAHADAHRIQQQAQKRGMRTMLEHGLERVNAGTTTIDEVLRVTNLE